MVRRSLAVLAAMVMVASLATIGIGGAVAGDSDRGRDRGRGHERLRAKLSGDNEVPPADPDGDGKAAFSIKVTDGKVCFSVRFDDITTANRAHIHVGAEGVNGPIVVPLFDLHTPESQADPRLDVLEKRSALRGCVTDLAPELLADIAADPGNFYCNIHNSRFPGGAIRGQLQD
jgi:hypothetical protein